MLLFRSEEHVDHWLEQRAAAQGVLMSLDQQWDLALKWHSERLSPTWRRFTPEEAEAIFESVGLTGDFWRLA